MKLYTVKNEYIK